MDIARFFRGGLNQVINPCKEWNFMEFLWRQKSAPPCTVWELIDTPQKYRLNDTFRIHFLEYIVVSFQITLCTDYSIRPERLDINLKPSTSSERKSSKLFHIKIKHQTNSSNHQLHLWKSFSFKICWLLSWPLPKNVSDASPFDPHNIPLFHPPAVTLFFLGFPCSNNLHMSRRLGVEAKKSRSKQSMKYLAVALRSIFEVVPEDVLCVNV